MVLKIDQMQLTNNLIRWNIKCLYNVCSGLINRVWNRPHNQSEWHTAEMTAILMALEWVYEVRPDKVIICSD